MNILWWNRKIYQRVLLIIGIVSILGLLPYFIEFIAACSTLNEAIANTMSYAKDSLEYELGLVGVGTALLLFFNSLGKLFFPLIFTTTCFIFAFLNIKTKEAQNDMKKVVDEPPAATTENSIAPITIKAHPIENYVPSSTVSFTIPENKKFEAWESPVEYYKIPLADIEKLKDKKLYCKPINDKHGGIFADHTFICNLYSTTHSDYNRNYGSEYCLDCFLIKTESDFIDKDLIKISVKFYIPKFTQKV